jgi:paired amphipathic helix protein Sin3a
MLPSHLFSQLNSLQVQGVLADQKSLDLRTLLENARGTDNASNREIIRYRREAELNVGSDEHLYRVAWVSYYKPKLFP